MKTALAEKLARLARTRLAEEAATLDPAEERRLADTNTLALAGWWRLHRLRDRDLSAQHAVAGFFPESMNG